MKKSISNNLALWLTVIIFLTAVLISIVLYLDFSLSLYDKLHQKGDEHINRLAGILSRPVWTYDSLNIETIGVELSQDPSIHTIRITDSGNDTLFEFIRNDLDQDLLLRSRPILRGDNAIGRVDLGFSKVPIQQELDRIFRFIFILLAIVLIIVLVGSRFLLNVLLRGPVSMLHTAIDNVSEGQFNQIPTMLEYHEFSGIISRFNRMTEQIRSREISLKEVNAELAGEIEERKKAEKALQHSESILRATLESTQDGVMVVETSGSVSVYNARFLEMWHLSEELVCAKNTGDVMDTLASQLKDPLAFTERVHTIKQTQTASEDVLHLLDGRSIERFSYPLAGRNRLGGRVWFFRDITDRMEAVRIKEQLESQLRQAQKMEAIGVFAGGIAHDFNNLLTIIIGNCELFLRIHSPDEAGRNYIQQSLNASQRARELVKQILTYSRQAEFTPKPAKLDNIIDDSLAFIRSLLPSSITIEQSVQPGIIAPVDKTQFHQVIMNMSINAGHAMQKKGGTLKIMLETVTIGLPMAHSRPTTLKPGQYALLCICDNGEGIPPEIIDRIFDPFFTTKNTDEGTGMGLAVVHGIIKSHGGEIITSSKVGHGSLFSIYLPLAEQSLGGVN